MRSEHCAPRILELEATLAQTKPQHEDEKRNHALTKKRPLEQEMTSLPAGLPVWTILGRGAVQRWSPESGVCPRLQEKYGHF